MDRKKKESAGSFIFSPKKPPSSGKHMLGMGAKLSILIIGVLTCITVITTIISVSHLRRAISTGTKEMARTMGRVVGISAAYQGFFEIDNRLLQQYVNFAAEQQNVSYAVIATGKDDVVQTGLTPEQLSRLLTGEKPFPPDQVHQEKQPIAFESPIGKVGTIYLGISKRGLREIEKKIVRLHILVAAAIAIIFLIVLWIIVFSITRPLRRLTEQARKIGDGILDDPLEIRGKDEVGRLAASIEVMRASLYKNIETLRLLGGDIP